MLSPNTRVSTSASPSGPSANGGKRKRKAFSCYECRRRKLKCDRGYPSCSRCRKAKQAEICIYDTPPSLSNQSEQLISLVKTANAPTQEDSPRRTDTVGNIASNLEVDQNKGTWQLLGQESSVTVFDAERPAVKADSAGLPNLPRAQDSIRTVIFRGENFKTQYYGGSNPASLIGHFPELRSFMKETIMHQSSLWRVQVDLKDLQKKWKIERTSILSLTTMELIDLLPDREEMDQLVRLYLDTFEDVYRILHIPSFEKEYTGILQEPLSSRPASVVIILLMMASVSCLSRSDQIRYIGDSSIARERATLWIEVCELWLKCQSQKNIYLAIWQVRCLLVLAKQANTVKKKRLWTEAGALVREAMAAGFHRDPGLLGERVSLFDREMRRRLWATMTELELQSSIDRGMSSVSAGIFTDTKNVLNIEDQNLSEEIEDQESPKSTFGYTPTSFLRLSNLSFPLRVSLNSIVNDLGSPLKYEDVLNYEELIINEIKKLPPQEEVQPDKKGLSLVARTLLDIQLRQFLILLHGPFARQTERTSRHSLSRMVCFDAAASILDQYAKLNELGNYALLLLRHDYFRAALVICQNSYISISLRREWTYDFQTLTKLILSTEDVLLNSNISVFLQYIDSALNMLQDRIVQLGTGYTHYWYISAGFALLRSAMSPDRSSLENQQAIDRVARQYYRVLASQEDIKLAKENIIGISLNKANSMGTQSHNAAHTMHPFESSLTDSTTLN
ncbi:hypothetical protein N7462_007302, partial [Penicillium macrosclerotiorum]|uniref:uncharacterized protein n=1 Tax=Penicillium macrosclerotiorum TaxID=303699 RepID=UPI0025487C7C